MGSKYLHPDTLGIETPLDTHPRLRSLHTTETLTASLSAPHPLNMASYPIRTMVSSFARCIFFGKQRSAYWRGVTTTNFSSIWRTWWTFGQGWSARNRSLDGFSGLILLRRERYDTGERIHVAFRKHRRLCSMRHASRALSIGFCIVYTRTNLTVKMGDGRGHVLYIHL